MIAQVDVEEIKCVRPARKARDEVRREQGLPRVRNSQYVIYVFATDYANSSQDHSYE